MTVEEHFNTVLDSLSDDQKFYMLEIVYQCLQDSGRYEWIAETLDLSDDQLMPLLVILHRAMSDGSVEE